MKNFLNTLAAPLAYPVLLLAMLGLSSLPAHADEPSCSVQDQSEALVLMLCPAQLDEAALSEHAKSACVPGQLCNVWIWDDRDNMPTKAPATDTELSRTHTGNAIAVWVNDSQSLIRLRQAR